MDTDQQPDTRSRLAKGVDRALDAIGLSRKAFGPPYNGPPPPNFPIGWFQQALDKAPYTDTRGGSVVEACVSAYAQTLAIVEFKHMRRLPDGGTEPVKGSSVSRLMSRPNSYSTRSDLMLNLITSLLYTGNGYLLATGGSTARSATEIHVLNPHTTMPHVIEGNVFYSVADELQIMGDIPFATNLVPDRFVGHVRMRTGNNPLLGVSPITYAAGAIGTNNAILGHSTTFFANASRPSGVLSTDMSLTKDQMVQLREAWENQARGMSTGGVPILSNGLSWQPLALSSVDADLVNLHKLTTVDIARIFRIPSALVNEMEQATFNNSETLLQFWLSSGLGFLIDHVEVELARLFDISEDTFIHGDTDILLRSNLEARMKALGTGVTQGILSPNEARKKEGLGPVKGGELPRMQLQQVPLDFEYEPSGGAAGPAPAADNPPDQAEIDNLLDDEEAA